MKWYRQPSASRTSRRQRLRLLRLVRVFGARVDLQLAELLHAQSVARQHALDGAANDLFRSPREQVGEGLLAVAARIARVARVRLLLALLAPNVDLRGIEHDDVVAGIDVRGVSGLVLALEHEGNP